MAWILMLLAVGCFLMLFVTKSFALGVLCLALALVLVVTATMMLLSARISNATRNAPILSPDELRVLREQAEAKRANAANATASPAGMTAAATSSSANPRPPSTTT